MKFYWNYGVGQLIGQEEIHTQCLSEDPEERIKALEQLKDNYSALPDKEQAWNDLHRLTNDEYIYVRSKVVFALGSAFSHIPDKQKAWNDLIRLTTDKSDTVRSKAVSALDSAFSQVPDKQKAWNDLIKLTTDKNSFVRSEVASVIGSAFSHVPDKQQAWNDLIKLTTDKNSSCENWVTSALYFFSFLPSEDRDVTVIQASVINSAFSHVPDKQKAWNDLIKLTTDKNSFARYEAASVLGSAFSQVLDKQKAWNDLIKLTTDKNSFVRSAAASVLGSAFPQVPDKQQVWSDLHKLTTNEIDTVRSKAVSALGSAFSHVPDKQQAWNDLHRLTHDKSWNVRLQVTSVLKSAYPDMPDKQQAWNDLIKLTSDKDWGVTSSAASALGSAYSQVPNKQQAWNDLHKLTSDEDISVRTFANHSLGKASIFKATQAEKEEDYKRELEKAIKFFEIAAQEDKAGSPSQFCLPFYRSFYTIIFQKQEEAKEEVDKYLAEAKDAVKGSKSKELLFEAVNNLANALKEVQNTENLDLEAKKGELNFYRQYCDRAAELMIETEETAPFATIAMRKGLPILDRSLQGLLEEIQKKAKITCKESKGTATEEIACAVSKEIQKWEISSQEEMAFNVENLIFTLDSSVPRIPENQYIFNRIQQVREQKDVAKQYGIISTIIPLIPKLYMEQTVDELKNDIKEVKEKVDYVTISLKPGIKEEIEISVGTEILGTGATHKITIPLQEISYSELKEDLEKITGMKIDKLSRMPKRLANKVKGYLLLHDKEDTLDKLT